MNVRDLISKPLPQMPSEIVDALSENALTPTPFERKNDILSDPTLHNEVGYTKLKDGAYLVSMVCPMPGITAEMVEWWFWWHAQDSLRYQAWHPGDHISIKYHRKDRSFFEQQDVPPFAPNTQYPVERIGGKKIPLWIDFVTPEAFGFLRQEMQSNHIPLIICGHVGAFNHWVRHTEMAHIFKQTDDGLFLISRFWLGETMKNTFLRKLIITDDMAKGMAEHCCIEYRNLCEILPALYGAYKSTNAHRTKSGQGHKSI